MRTTYTLMSIPNGVNGTKTTLRIMREIVRKYKKDPAIYELSRKLVNHLGQKDWRGEGRALHNFVRDKIRYVKDIRGVETIQTPVETFACWKR